jgi:hypothetical protein
VCGDSAELGIARAPNITAVTPTLATTASQYPPGGKTLYDIAHLAGGIDPGGAITFILYGPDGQDTPSPAPLSRGTNRGGAVGIARQGKASPSSFHARHLLLACDQDDCFALASKASCRPNR